MAAAIIACWAFFAAFVMTQIGDAVSTFLVLARGGRETNAVILKLASKIGVRSALVVFKVVTVGLVGAFVWFVGPGSPVVVTAVLALLCVVYVSIVAHNLVVWVRQGKATS